MAWCSAWRERDLCPIW